MAEYRVRVDDDDALARELLDALARRGEVRMAGAVEGRALVLGGARSGKSVFAERQFGEEAIDYVATSAVDPSDAEWSERIRLHQERRPDEWRTIETVDVAGLLLQDGPPVLVDCLSVWLTRQLDECGAWEEAEGWREALAAEVSRLVDAVRRTRRRVVVVSNEVGSGVVPATASGRLFRDELGRLNARVAAECDQVWLVVAGVPGRLK